MNNLYELLLSIGDDSILIKDTSLALLKFSIIPLIFSIIKINKIKVFDVCSIEGFWIFVFVSSFMQLIITSIVTMTDLSYWIVSCSVALILIKIFQGWRYEN